MNTPNPTYILALSCLSPAASAQSLFTAPIEREAPAPVIAPPRGEPTPDLYGWSTTAIRPPEPREFRIHDLVTIVIDEQSKSTSNQKLETEKEASNKVRLDAVLDPMELLELRLVQDDLTALDLINASGEREFEGEGDYERTDRFTARITAEIIDVKPNGTIVLEAKKEIVRDKEETLLVLSGVCRQEDVTSQNTILSSQLANLRLEQHNTGDVKKAASKGFLTNALDTIFNF